MMDYEELSDVRRLDAPSAGAYLYSGRGGVITAGASIDGHHSPLVNHNASLPPTSPSATVVHEVDPPLYSRVIRRCSPA